MEKKLQMMEEDMQKLETMNLSLFETWQDQLSNKFSVECVGALQGKWKEYSQAIEPLIRQLKKLEADMEDLNRQIKQR